MKTLPLVASLLLLATPAFAAKAKPNILMIAVDDLNDWVGAFGGHPQAKTPHMDRLAQKSMVFRNASEKARDKVDLTIKQRRNLAILK